MSKPTTFKDVLKAIYYMGKDGEGLSDYKLNQAKQDILDLLESKANTDFYYLDEDDQRIKVDVIPLSALKELGDK